MTIATEAQPEPPAPREPLTIDEVMARLADHGYVTFRADHGIIPDDFEPDEAER